MCPQINFKTFLSLLGQNVWSSANILSDLHASQVTWFANRLWFAHHFCSELLF